MLEYELLIPLPTLFLQICFEYISKTHCQHK